MVGLDPGCCTIFRRLLGLYHLSHLQPALLCVCCLLFCNEDSSAVLLLNSTDILPSAADGFRFPIYSTGPVYFFLKKHTKKARRRFRHLLVNRSSNEQPAAWRRDSNALDRYSCIFDEIKRCQNTAVPSTIGRLVRNCLFSPPFCLS